MIGSKILHIFLPCRCPVQWIYGTMGMMEFTPTLRWCYMAQSTLKEIIWWAWPDHVCEPFQSRVFSPAGHRNRRQRFEIGEELDPRMKWPHGKECGWPRRAERGSQLTDLSPTTVRKWILLKREFGKGPRALDENAAPPDTSIPARQDPEKRIWMHHIQTSDLWKLWNNKFVLF